MRLLVPLLAVVAVACGPSRNQDKPCTGAECSAGSCNSGDVRECYTGADGTDGVGTCKGGMQTCTSAGQWGDCAGEVVPTGEVCGNGKDEDCDGQVDENKDDDGDGWTTCDGDCCDDPTECSTPNLVNPGAYEIAGDGVDNDCDGQIDNAVPTCDATAMGNSSNPYDYAAAIDLCPSTTLQGSALMSDPQRHWGIIDAKLTLADGSSTPNNSSLAILPKYGTGVMPHAGSKLMLVSTGYAAGESDPGYDQFLSGSMGTSSGFPADWLSANSGKLPNAPGCPGPKGSSANDPVMLTLKVRVPTNAQSFSMDVDFFSSEFPEYTCSAYNDFFVVLLDSMYSGMPANPPDKNLAFYLDPSMKKYPVGVNLASGNTGLFTECMNGTTGCAGTAGSINTCKDTMQLQGTGLEQPDPGACDLNALWGGGTGWLTTSGNVMPGEIMTLRIAIWDTSDDMLDSMAVIDNFHWNVQTSQPGTVIQ